MKKLIFIFLVIAISFSGFSQQHMSTGMSGSAFRTLFNANVDTVAAKSVFMANVYGAVGNNSTDNTTAIQNLINKVATIGGGIIHFQTGIYLTHTLTLPYTVTLEGDGYGMFSQLRSISAEPMINVIHTLSPYQPYNNLLHNICLNGNNIGTIGLNTQLACYFNMQNVIIVSFTNTQLYLKATLVGQFTNCQFGYGQYGVYSTKEPITGWTSNNIIFNECQFLQCSNWAYYNDAGASVIFKGCDLEQNGTASDTTTGVVHYTNIEAINNKYIIGLIMEDNWIEANNGQGIFIGDIGDTGVRNLSIISNNLFAVNTFTNGSDLKVVSGISYNTVILNSNTFSDASPNIRIFGAYSKVIDYHSYLYGSVVQGVNGTYINPVYFDGNINVPSTTAPIDTVYSRGWGTIYKNGVSYKVKLYH